MEKLLLIPGPSPVVPRILEALAVPTVSHVSPEMGADLTAALENLKRIVFTTSGEPFIIAGAGTLSMEIALLNVAGEGRPGPRSVPGLFRRPDGADLRELRHRPRRRPEPVGKRGPARGAGRNARREKRYDVVAVTHVDTSTGACAPVEAYARILKDTGIL